MKQDRVGEVRFDCHKEDHVGRVLENSEGTYSVPRYGNLFSWGCLERTYCDLDRNLGTLLTP